MYPTRSLWSFVHPVAGGITIAAFFAAMVVIILDDSPPKGRSDGGGNFVTAIWEGARRGWHLGGDEVCWVVATWGPTTICRTSWMRAGNTITMANITDQYVCYDFVEFPEGLQYTHEQMPTPGQSQFTFEGDGYGPVAIKVRGRNPGETC